MYEAYAQFIVECLLVHLKLNLDPLATENTLRYQSRHLPVDTLEDFGSIVLLECSEGIERNEHIDDVEFRRICDRIAHRIAYRLNKQLLTTEPSKQASMASVQLELISADEKVQALNEAIEKLQPTERLLVEQHYLEGTSLRQLATTFGLKLWEVRKRLSTALESIKASIKE